MLIILFLFALTRSLRGSPLSPQDCLPVEFTVLDTRDSISNHFGQRTVQDIVISCVATIFACTWTAIHPNIPAPTDCWWTRFKRQVMTMIYALLVPELITIWALNQRMAAKEIMEGYNKEILGAIDDAQKERNLWMAVIDAVKCTRTTTRNLFYNSPLPVKSEKGPRWTMTHGFFLQMGGFMLSEGGELAHTLLDGSRMEHSESQKLLFNIEEGIIDPPRITADDIMDRSKGDAISKTIIILQTTWFIVQCIARWSQHLPVTELEIITLGFATLNGITYGLWWHKPQNVARPVFLERKQKKTVGIPEVNDSSDDARAANSMRSEATSVTSEGYAWDTASLFQVSNATKDSWLGRKIRAEIQNRMPWLLPVIIPYRVIHAFFRGFKKLLDNNGDGKHRVPIFYSAGSNGEDWALIDGISIIGPLFGSVHLIPSWFLAFGSRQEMWLWRVSSIIITAVPMGFRVGAMVAHVHQISNIVNIFVSIGFFLYPIARLILIILSITALRYLPPGALQTIEWTTFIPHL